MNQRLLKVVLPAVLLCVLLTSCTSIPLRTMLKLRGFSSDDFKTLDPNEVMLKVVFPEPLEVNPEATYVEVDFLFSDQSHKSYHFPMELVSTDKETKGWRRKTTWTHFTLQITPEGKKSFVQLQRELAKNILQKPTCTLNARASFKNPTSDEMPDSCKISLLLQLKEEEGFFPLIDDAKIKLRKTE